jgi:hypothetical protein
MNIPLWSSNTGRLLLFFLVLTVLDIVVVELYYRPLRAWDRIWMYHLIYIVGLQYLIPLIWAIKEMSWHPLRLWILWFFGLEDTLFYLLQGYLPMQFLGVRIAGMYEPYLNQVIVLNLIGLVLFIVMTKLIRFKYVPKHTVLCNET